MKIKIKLTNDLKESSVASGGSIAGAPATPTVDEEELNEMFSSSGLSGKNKQQQVSPEEEWRGYCERATHQGLKNSKGEACPEEKDTFLSNIFKQTPQK